MTADQDMQELRCIPAGSFGEHITIVHEKCWEKHKKQYLRAGAGRRTNVNFFCLHPGCHNALHGQHTSVRAVEAKVERKMVAVAESEDGPEANGHGGGGSGGGGSGSDGKERATLSAAEAEERRLRRDAELGLLEEVDDFEGKCTEPKSDGTRCGRPIFNTELGCCRLHVESVKKKRLLTKMLTEDDASGKPKPSNPNSSAGDSSLLATAAARPRASAGIGMSIPDKAPALPPPPPRPPPSTADADGSDGGDADADADGGEPLPPPAAGAGAPCGVGGGQERHQQAKVGGHVALHRPGEARGMPDLLRAHGEH